MSKKLLILFVILLFGLLTIVGISSNPLKAKDVVTIKYAFWGNPDAIGVEKDIIDEFEKTNPSIKIQPVVSSYTDYHTKLLVMIAGGMGPDVMRVNSIFAEDFLKANALLDITDLIKRDNINLDLYYGAGLVENSYKGRYYGLPWGTAPCYIAVNLKMFKDAGIPLPSYNWTWDDFVNINKKLSKTYQYAYAAPFEMEDLLPFVWGAGVDLFDKSRQKFTLNRPVAIERIQQLADMMKEGIIANPALVAGSQDTRRLRWIVNNEVAMVYAAAIEVLTLQSFEGFEFEVLPFPGGPVSERTTIYKSNILGINSKTKNLEAAWEFLKFLRTPEGTGEKLYCESKRTPPSVKIPGLWDLYSDPNKYPKNIKEVTNLIAEKHAYMFPLRAGWMEVKGLIDPQLQKIWAGQMSAEKALNEIAPKVQEVLNRTKRP